MENKGAGMRSTHSCLFFYLRFETLNIAIIIMPKFPPTNNPTPKPNQNILFSPLHLRYIQYVHIPPFDTQYEKMTPFVPRCRILNEGGTYADRFNQ